MTGMVMVTKSISGICRGESTIRTSNNSKHHHNDNDNDNEEEQEEEKRNQNQVSLMELLIAALRKSMVSCRVMEQQQGRDGGDDDAVSSVEIGWPTNVRHITHVTFDRFHGFLGLPVEFQVEVPVKAPSASKNVFGVSAESMQCCYDSRGNSVPTILLLMQERLYSQGGLKAEGIFRINPENSKEEHVRDQLNRGIVPDDIDVHCLAGLIKAWFRELPSGVLDGLSPEQVLECNTEEDSVEVVKLLKPTEAALLNWAIDLMADVVEEEDVNKMNARNIAMVFAPNMTQMSDPLTALMHAVQVMNLLKTLITKTIREREDTGTEGSSPLSSSLSSQQTDEDYDSQQEMDTSCELRRTPASEFDDSHHACYSNSSDSEEEEDQVESLHDVEKHFLRKLEETTVTASAENMQIGRESPKSVSSANYDSSISFSDSKVGSLCTISTSETEDSSSSSFTTTSQLNGPKNPLEVSEVSTEDKEMVDNQTFEAHLS